jgi:putative ABC transport system substrate-binding protein
MMLGGALAAPFALAGEAPAKVRRVAFVTPNPLVSKGPRFEALRAGLRELGHTEGRNLVLEARWPEGRDRRLRDVAQELIDGHFEVIVAHTNGAVVALMHVLKAQKAEIPVVMATCLDPVRNGIVASLEHPQADITGLAAAVGDVVPRQVALLAELVPGLSRIAALTFPAHTSLVYRVTTASQASGIATLPHVAQTSAEIDTAFDAIVQERAQAVVVGFDTEIRDATAQIAELARRHRLPTIFATREQAEGGGLMSYGEDIRGTYRLAAAYVDKILKGASAARLPVAQVKRDFAVNRKTAAALGIKIPAAMLAKATKIIG